MIWLIFIAVVILFRVLRPWIPSTILLDWFRTQRDPKWGLWAVLAGVVYFGFAYGCTVLIDNEALPGDEHGPTYLGRASGALQA